MDFWRKIENNWSFVLHEAPFFSVLAASSAARSNEGPVVFDLPPEVHQPVPLRTLPVSGLSHHTTLAKLFYKVPYSTPLLPPLTLTDVEFGTTPFRDLLVPSVLDRSRQMNRGVRRKFCRSYLRCSGRAKVKPGGITCGSSRTHVYTRKI